MKLSGQDSMPKGMARITDRSNGRPAEEPQPPEIPRLQVLSRRLRQWLRQQDLAALVWCSRPTWRQTPLTCANRLLLIVALLATLAAPLYLWHDSSELESLAYASQPAKRQPGRGSQASTRWFQGETRENEDEEDQAAAHDRVIENRPERARDDDDWFEKENWYEAGEKEEAGAPPAPAVKFKPKPSPGLTSEYVRIAARRNYFRAGASSEPDLTLPAVSSSVVPGLSERYSLLGVLMGASPQAIVRENSSNTSMFLSAGQNLGEYRVREIKPDRVILEQYGQLFELSM